jgi:hypothetical protein
MVAWLQRAANTDQGHDFDWLGDHFTAVKPSHRCVYMGDRWFANLRSEIDEAKRRSLPIETLVELARLQGARLPGDDLSGKTDQ